MLHKSQENEPPKASDLKNPKVLPKNIKYKSEPVEIDFKEHKRKRSIYQIEVKIIIEI